MKGNQAQTGSNSIPGVRNHTLFSAARLRDVIFSRFVCADSPHLTGSSSVQMLTSASPVADVAHTKAGLSVGNSLEFNL